MAKANGGSCVSIQSDHSTVAPKGGSVTATKNDLDSCTHKVTETNQAKKDKRQRPKGRGASTSQQTDKKDKKSKDKIEKVPIDLSCVESQNPVSLQGSIAYVTIGKQKIQALVDTGALKASCLSQAAYDRYNLNKVRSIQPSVVTVVKGVGTNSVPVVGEVELPIKIGPLQTNHRFYVLKTMNHQMILGMDFLSKHVSSMDFQKNQLLLKDCTKRVNLFQMPDSHTVHMVNNISIPARSEMLIPAQVRHMKGCDLDKAILTPVPSLSWKNSVAGACTIAKVDQGKTVFRMLNPTNVDINLKKGQVIARLSNLEDVIMAGTLSSKVNQPNSSSSLEGTTINQVADNSDQSGQPTDEYYIKVAKDLGFDLKDTVLNEEEKRALLILLGKNRDVFAKDLTELGTGKVKPHIIDTGDANPIKLRPYRVNPDKKEEIDKQVKEMLQSEVIEPSVSEWQAPVVLVKKKDQKWRFAVDYRRLNAVTKPITYPLPRIEDVFDAIGKRQAKFYSTLDLASGFWQLPLDPSTAHKTAFATHSGVYQFKKLPFGLRNSPSAFAMAMNHVLRDITFQYAIVYVDDILIFSRSFQDHLDHLAIVFDRLRQAQLKLKPSKCKFAAPKVEYLGHMISCKGVEMESAKTKAIEQYPRPHNLRTLRGFLGLANYYRRFVKGFAHIARPLNRLTNKEIPFEWNDSCETSFQQLKSALMSGPILMYPDFEREFILYTDASDTAIGFILGQKDEEGRERAVAYAGKSLSKAQQNWDTRDKELLAVVEGIKYYHVYLTSDKPFTVYTDHRSLQYLLNLKPTSGRLARWLNLIQGYNYRIAYKEGKTNTNADALSRIDHQTVVTEEYKGEDSWINSATTLQEQPPTSSPAEESPGTEFIEYHLVLPTPTVATVAVESLTEEERQTLEDSLLQRAPLQHLKELRPIEPPAVRQLQQEDEEFGNIWRYLENDTLPEDTKQRSSVVAASQYYFLDHQNVLYHTPKPSNKPGKPLQVQLAVPKVLRDDLLKSFHDCIAGGGHQGSNRVYQALREKYFWKSMMKDVSCYVGSCLTCQQANRNYAGKPAPLHPIPPANIFSRMHMDILGPLPKSEEGYKYILLVVDAFSKWCEAFPLKTMEATEVAKYLYQDIICRYGAPDVLVSDRAQNFMSKVINHLSSLFQITRHFTSSYHPASNATVERMNSTMANILRGYVDSNQKDWPDYLSSVMMAYRITPCTESTHFSPYYLLFGKECRRPIDVALTPPQNLGKNVVDYLIKMGQRKRVTVEIARENIKQHQEKYKKVYDKKTKVPSYIMGDRVWLYCAKVPVGKSPKLIKKWTGPYYIARVCDKWTYKLHRVDDHRAIKSRIHANRLKPFYDPEDRPTNPPPELQHATGELDPDELEDVPDEDQSVTDSQPTQAARENHDQHQDKALPEIKDPVDAGHPESHQASQDNGSSHDEPAKATSASQSEQWLPVKKIMYCKKINGIRWYRIQYLDKNIKQCKQLVHEDRLSPFLRNKFHAEFQDNGKRKGPNRRKRKRT